jgi:hypothetical protein
VGIGEFVSKGEVIIPFRRETLPVCRRIENILFKPESLGPPGVVPKTKSQLKGVPEAMVVLPRDIPRTEKLSPFRSYSLPYLDALQEGKPEVHGCPGAHLQEVFNFRIEGIIIAQTSRKGPGPCPVTYLRG